MLIKDLMSHTVGTCRADDTLAHAAQIMRDQEVRVLAVCNDRGRLVGMVTERDLCLTALAQGGALADHLVHLAMTHRPVSVRADGKLADAEEVMSAHKVHQLPVVDDLLRPIGMIGVDDLIRGAMAGSAEIASGTVLRILSAIGRTGGAATAPSA